MLVSTGDKTGYLHPKKRRKNAIAQSIYFVSPTIWFYEAGYGDGQKVCQKGKREFHER